MLEYPQIPGATGMSFREFRAHVFDKLDGNNLRFEWNPKKGWYKAGTRYRRFDETDKEYGSAMRLFAETLSEPLAKIARDNRWMNLIVFTEWWGAKTLAGLHVPDDPKALTLFDASMDREVLMAPRDFLRAFDGKVPTARYLGQLNWTRGFVEQVYRGEVEGITAEGVVGKTEVKGSTVMAKAKTKTWIDAIKARYAAHEADRILAS